MRDDEKIEKRYAVFPHSYFSLQYVNRVPMSKITLIFTCLCKKREAHSNRHIL